MTSADASDSERDGPTDGRIQRSERSREAIVSAMLELIGEGDLSPTAQQVAERAEVGVRTVFRHFSDMDTLFSTMNERLTDQSRRFFVSEVQTGPLAKRLEDLLDRRAAAYDELEPYLHSGSRKRASSNFLQNQHATNIRRLRADLRRSLPEVEAADTEVADAFEAALSFETFHHLRFGQNLSTRRTHAAVRALALASRL